MAEGTCVVAGCERPQKAHGLCTLHYRRHRKWGTTDLPPKRTAAERFWAKVDKAGPIAEARPDLGPCWMWTAFLHPAGYGMFNVGGVPRMRGAHRVAYELLVGPVPAGLHLDHLCRNRACVNPDHLEPVTVAVNILRGIGWGAQYARKTHCPQGHPYTDENTYRSPGRGARECRTCQQARAEERAERRRALKRPPKTHCPKGHPYAGDNLFICSRGKRGCRACRAIAARNSLVRRKAREGR
jgi:hypothetical protein